MHRKFYARRSRKNANVDSTPADSSWEPEPVEMEPGDTVALHAAHRSDMDTGHGSSHQSQIALSAI